MSIDWTIKYNEMLFSHKKEWSTDTWMNLENIKQKKLDTKLYNSVSIKYSE